VFKLNSNLVEMDLQGSLSATDYQALLYVFASA